MCVVKKEKNGVFLKDARGAGNHRSWPGGRGGPRALVAGVQHGGGAGGVGSRNNGSPTKKGQGLKALVPGGVGGKGTVRNVCCIFVVSNASSGVQNLRFRGGRAKGFGSGRIDGKGTERVSFFCCL